MSKFDNAIAEAAYEIAGHGFTEETYGEVSTTGWNALVTVTPSVLLNLGSDSDLIDRVRAEGVYELTDGVLAWIRESNEGFVTLVEHSTDVAEVEAKWNAFVAEM